jgi:hypothetical protein
MALIANPAGREAIRYLMTGTARLALQGGHERRSSAMDQQIVIFDDQSAYSWLRRLKRRVAMAPPCPSIA